MKVHEMLAAVVLVIAAVCLVFWKSGGESAEDQQRELNGAGGAGGMSQRSASDGDDPESTRNPRSTRVRREKPETITTSSGLQYQVLTEGEGDYPGPESQVKVHYVGTLEDGTVFDSSRERGTPLVFGLNQVIKGWTEGVQLMQPGALYKFTIPSELGYGDRGAGTSIPANATLVFEVELISIEKP